MVNAAGIRGGGANEKTNWPRPDGHTGSLGFLEEESTKDTPSFRTEDFKEIHRSGTEVGVLGIYNFPGAVFATDGSNDKGIMGAGYFKLDDANWAEARKEIPPIGLN